MSDASTLPPEFYNAFGIDSASFQSAFQDSGNEMFSLRPGWSLGFTHAVLALLMQCWQPVINLKQWLQLEGIP